VTVGRSTIAAHTHLIADIQGSAQLSRKGWKSWVPIGAGTLLHPNDLLDVSGSVTLLCADLSVVVITSRARPPCPTDQGVLEYHGAEFSSLQRSAADPIPYILHPRHTLVLEPRPLLRWHDTGAASYTLALTVDSTVVWAKDDVVGSQLHYPNDAPLLIPGKDYLLTVKDNTTGRTSLEDPAKGLGFQILDQQTRQAIATQRDALMQRQELADSSRQLALAVYYMSLGPSNGRALWGEAWLLLENVVQVRGDPAIYRLSGDALRAMALPNEAESAYATAARQAEQLGDIETRAVALANLWRLTSRQESFDEALRLYTTLGDTASADGLRKEHGP
jgi:hypothetical protein